MGVAGVFERRKQKAKARPPVPRPVAPRPGPDLERAAADIAAVDATLAATPWWQYRRLDQEHRSRTLTAPDWFRDWQGVRPEDVETLAVMSGRPLATGGLLSMHSNGYVREAAVQVLAESADPNALPFLLLRSADWVAEVREPAQQAVRDLRARVTTDQFLRSTPLLEMMATNRARANDFAVEVLGWVTTDADEAALLDGLVGEDQRSRRTCARILAERGAAPKALAIALSQSDVITARVIAMAALDEADDPGPVLESLRRSRVASLRALALFRYQTGGSPLAVRSSKEGLFDRSASVRDLAQRFLATDAVDVRQAYIDALPANLIALQGVAEVGTSDDFAIVEPYLDDPRSRARALAVSAIGRLLDTRSRPLMLTKLDDASPSVVRAAGRVLSRQRLDDATLDYLWQRAMDASSEALLGAAFTVFAQQGRWARLVLACRAVVLDEEDVQRRGQQLLESTLAYWSNSFTEPTSAQRTELQLLEPRVGPRVTRRTAQELGGLLAQYPA
jgi:HEAT repeat protein